jgi:hypothetical protein
MPPADVVRAFFDFLTLDEVNILSEYFRQLFLHSAQRDWPGVVFVLKTDKHADSAVGPEILMEDRAEEAKFTDIVLPTKLNYLVFRHRYMAIHISSPSFPLYHLSRQTAKIVIAAGRKNRVQLFLSASGKITFTPEAGHRQFD